MHCASTFQARGPYDETSTPFGRANGRQKLPAQLQYATGDGFATTTTACPTKKTSSTEKNMACKTTASSRRSEATVEKVSARHCVPPLSSSSLCVFGGGVGGWGGGLIGIGKKKNHLISVRHLVLPLAETSSSVPFKSKQKRPRQTHWTRGENKATRKSEARSVRQSIVTTPRRRMSVFTDGHAHEEKNGEKHSKEGRIRIPRGVGRTTGNGRAPCSMTAFEH